VALENRRALVGKLASPVATLARAHDASVATRNISDFEGCGIELLDPWDRATKR
jgi:predicted nucleic acid-binding protein